MACENMNSSTRNFILDTINRIDQMQKEAVIENTCEGCEGTLMSRLYNTKPVRFYLCQGRIYEVTVPDTTMTTDTFRIEKIQGTAVILRLITFSGNEATCTPYTVILNLDCVCSLQCLAPICCERCPNNCI